MSDATVHGGNRLVCGVHGSTYNLRSGTNLHYENADLERIEAWVEDGAVWVDADFVKALALGADAIAVSNSAIQSIGCPGMRACHTNNCPVGIATQQPHLRERLPVDEAPNA